MEDDEHVRLEECDPEKSSTSNAVPIWPSKESIKDLKSSPKKTKRKNAASEKKVKATTVDKDKPVKPKQTKAPVPATEFDVKAVQRSFGYACMTLSKKLSETLAAEHNLNDVQFTPEVIARTAQIVQTVMESKWAPNLTAFSKHAKRAKITADDARLLFHRNSELLAKIDEPSGEALPATTIRRPSPLNLPDIDADVGEDEEKKLERKRPLNVKVFSSIDAQVPCAMRVQVDDEILSTARSLKSVKADVSAVTGTRRSLFVENTFCSNRTPVVVDGDAREQQKGNKADNDNDSFNDDVVFCSDNIHANSRQKEEKSNNSDDSFNNDEIFDDQDDSVDDILLESFEDNKVKTKEVREIVVGEVQDEWLIKDQVRTSPEKKNAENGLVAQVTSVPQSLVAQVIHKEVPSMAAIKDKKGRDSDDSFYNDDDIDAVADDKVTEESDGEEILWESYRESENGAGENQQKFQASSKLLGSSSLNQPTPNKLAQGDNKACTQIGNKRPSDEPTSTPVSKISKTSATMEIHQSTEEQPSKKHWNPFKASEITPPPDNFLEKKQPNNARKSVESLKELGYKSDDSLFDDDDDGLF